MCSPIHKRHAAPIQEQLDSISRPMRYASRQTEPIARRAIAAIGREWLKFVDNVAKALPSGKEFGGEYTPVLIEEKQFELWEIEQFDRDFNRTAGASTSAAIDSFGKDFLDSVAGKSGAPQISTNPVPLDTMYYTTVTAAGTEATKITRKEWERMPLSWRRQNPWVAGQYVYDPGLKWVKDLYKQGFTLVKNGMFRQLIPALKRDIAAWVDQGRSWSEISQDLWRLYGGKLWHWERLVRTEMVSAITTASIERYRELGAQFLKWSLGSNACLICTGFRNQVNALETGDPEQPVIMKPGVWKIGEQPAIPGQTHPYCRCLFTPRFRI